MRTVGCDHVLRTHRLSFTRVAMANDRCHAVRVLLDRDAFGRKQDSRAVVLRAFLECRLEGVLRQKHPHGRAKIPNAIVEIRDVVGSRTTRQRFDTNHAGVLHELCFGLGANDLFQADAAEDLHRALGDRCGARMNRRAAMMLDDE